MEIFLIDIKTDADGIDTTALRSTLENWPVDKALPKVLYTVPVCARIISYNTIGEIYI